MAKNETITINGGRTETVGKDERITIGGGRTETVAKDESITIDGGRTENVAKDESITIGGGRTENVAKDESVTIGGGRTESVGKDERVTVTGGRTVERRQGRRAEGRQEPVIDAGDSITIKTGSASITMKKDGTITIKGKDISIDGSGQDQRQGVQRRGDQGLEDRHELRTLRCMQPADDPFVALVGEDARRRFSALEQRAVAIGRGLRALAPHRPSPACTVSICSNSRWSRTWQRARARSLPRAAPWRCVAAMIGRQVVVLFEQGDPRRPIIIGVIEPTALRGASSCPRHQTCTCRRTASVT